LIRVVIDTKVALDGRADVIVSGDDDLLSLHPFENIPIVGPREFLSIISESPAP